MMAIHEKSAMPSLITLLDGIADIPAGADRPIAGIELDSRRIRPGDLFFALEGSRTSGARFIHDAISNGAAAILVDSKINLEPTFLPVPICRVTDLHSKTGMIASRFFAHPSHHVRVTGITGTNGKTSIAWYLGQTLVADSSSTVGVIGTLGYGVFGTLTASPNTTPDAVTVQRILDKLRNSHVREVAMEVSSHALDQGRVNGVLFDTAVFTNLSRDHLDYHKDMAAYANAKKKLFMSEGLQHAVINADDAFGARLIAEFAGRVNTTAYSLCDAGDDKVPAATVQGILKSHSLNALQLDIKSPWGSGELHARLTGKFNAWNLLASLSVLCLHGIPFEQAIERLSRVQGVPGRMEYFGNANSPAIIVDYSHTPDALEKALGSLRGYCRGKLVCVFGCGGDRDRGKRAQMGHIAEAGSDRVILTSDNPRSEQPTDIINNIKEGMRNSVPVEVYPDREQAIRTAISTSSRDDVILIAGKGHETWQEVMGDKLPFSDRDMVRALVEKTA
jgi:UDP-N-acetylmuramoyl-L-alanyl-D-glutamate--2,6-diaminopimelate ligase